MQISFGGSSQNALSFFDLSGNETLRIDEFLFGVEFFISGNRLKDCLMLFSELDVNKDGLLDEIEFDQLFTMQVGASALRDGALPQDPINGVAEDDLGNYIQGGYNTYNKRPL